MEKKLIGYKLKDLKYQGFANKMVDSFYVGTSDIACFRPNDLWFKTFKDAGVLDLWFKPVYEGGLREDHTGWINNDKNPKWLMYSEEGICKYGFLELCGRFTNTNLGDPITPLESGDKRASDQEVRDALIKEAVKQGFAYGVSIKSKFSGWVKENRFHKSEISEDWNFKPETNELMFCGVLIFRKGVWATIVKEDKFRDFKATRNFVIFKGYEFRKDFILNKDFDSITSLNTVWGDNKFQFSKADVKLIKEYVNEKLK